MGCASCSPRRAVALPSGEGIFVEDDLLRRGPLAGPAAVRLRTGKVLGTAQHGVGTTWLLFPASKDDAAR